MRDLSKYKLGDRVQIIEINKVNGKMQKITKLVGTDRNGQIALINKPTGYI